MAQGIFEEVLNKGAAMHRMQRQFVPTKEEIFKSWVDFLEKGKKAQIGEIREWKGGRYRKTELGWIPAVQGRRTARKDKQGQPHQWDGELSGPENFGSPQFEQDLKTELQTMTQYKKDGEWTEDRIRKVHAPIVESFVKRGTKNSDGVKTVTLMMGAPASGKGHLRKNLISKGILESSLVAIDPDDIKTKAMAPDYDRYSESNARTASSFVHEEGSDIAKEAFSAMEEKGYDYLQDKVFSNYKKLTKEIDRLNKAGYKVKIIMASCPVNIAYPRMLERGKKTGRYVAKDYFYESHAEIEETWSKLMESMPEGVISAQKYNTATQSNEPELIDNFEAK